MKQQTEVSECYVILANLTRNYYGIFRIAQTTISSMVFVNGILNQHISTRLATMYVYFIYRILEKGSIQRRRLEQ
ncbi:MAG: hypothetical protein BZ138_07305 [Methanosphaera sp. rholeuAM270]|nr:MAG: hypothetical protein BZ138_07305 [Methanosphaera sp. rholeuAM270]